MVRANGGSSGGGGPVTGEQRAAIGRQLRYAVAREQPPSGDQQEREALERSQQLRALELFLRSEGRRDWRARFAPADDERGVRAARRSKSDAGFVHSVVAAADLSVQAERTARPWLERGLIGWWFQHWRWAMTQVSVVDAVWTVQMWCLDGLTREEIADELGCHPSTVSSWKLLGLGEMVDAMDRARRGEVVVPDGEGW